jgi:hypothetical protein
MLVATCLCFGRVRYIMTAPGERGTAWRQDSRTTPVNSASRLIERKTAYLLVNVESELYTSKWSFFLSSEKQF